MIEVQYNDGRCQILRDGVELCDLSIDDAITVKETLIRDGDKPKAADDGIDDAALALHARQFLAELPVPAPPCAPPPEFCTRCGQQHNRSNCPTPTPPGPPNPPRFFSCCGARFIIGVAEQHKSTCQRHHGGNVGVSWGMETGISRLVAAGTAPDAEGSESQFKSDALTSPAAPGRGAKVVKYALLVVWNDGSSDYLLSGSTIARFTKSAAEKQKDFLMIGMADDVQSISVVKYPKARG